MEPGLIARIRELLVLQVALMDAFQKLHPSLKDWRFLLDFPRSGEIRVANEAWKFQRRSAGLMYTSADGTVVDIQRDARSTKVFDKCQLMSYLESVHCPMSKNVTAEAMSRLEKRGDIVSVNDASNTLHTGLKAGCR